MRPLRVVMHAFGPFAGHQVIDFRELGDNRFFLVHGPTGAGKTTVLDAMCYALYGRTTGEERTAEEMRSHFASAEVPTEVEFDFAVGGECYRVRRRPAQQRMKARGAGTRLDAAQVTLWRRTAETDDSTDGDPIATRARDVAIEVERIIGFSAEQFRQVVMLPQGRFRELLSADSKQREQIMQALFGTGRYASIESRLKERRRGLESGLEQQVTRRSEVLREAGVADDTELEALCGALTAEAASRGEAAELARAAALTAAAGLARAREAQDALEQAAIAEGEAVACAETLRQAQEAAAQATEALAAQEQLTPDRELAAGSVRDLEVMSARADLLAQAAGALEAARAARDVAAAQAQVADARVESASSELKVAQAEERTAGQAAAGLLAAKAELEAADDAVRSALRVSTAGSQLAMASERRSAAAEALRKADASLGAARKTLDRTRKGWAAGRAAALAAALEPGQPCPVCGSTDHPAPARSPRGAADDLAMEEAEAEFSRAEALRTGCADTLAAAESSLAAAQAGRDAILESAPQGPVGAAAETRLADAQSAWEAASAAGVRAQAAAGRVAEISLAVEEARREAAAASQALKECDTALASCAATLAEREREVPEELRRPGALAAALEKARERSEALQLALKSAQEASKAADLECRAAQERSAGAEKALAKARKRAVGVEAVDMDAMGLVARQTEAARDEAVEAFARADESCARAARARARLAEIDAASGALSADYKVVAALADAAVGQNPLRLSFQRYVLGVFLAEVLDAATKRLTLMTRGRYRLHMAAGARDRRSAGGLDLEVFDEYTGDDRPVSTLSGGEGFLASLSLALGLAEVVESLAGGVHLDTVFVDEGFGTLDEEALETAIQALMELQGRGRLVGIISHVPELRHAIPARLEISATPSGSSARFVVP